MPRRSPLGLDDVASHDNLTAAFWRAARGHRHRADVQHFAAHLDREIARLRDDILDSRAPEGVWTAFRVFDPKPRRILAPCFRDRVLHHALMARMGPPLDRALVDDTFACRVGKGTLAAVRRAQEHLRAHPWYVQVDVRGYFASIDHGITLDVIARRFKHPSLLALCARILARTPGEPGRGLPIGALTSQYFANSYLDALDRHLLERLRVGAMVRYMDDIVWWCASRAQAQETLADVREYLLRARALVLKPDARIARSEEGVEFLGFHVGCGRLGLSRRRRRRYKAARRRAERLYAEGRIDASSLQRRYDAALAITAHADVIAWRRAELCRRPPLDA